MVPVDPRNWFLLGMRWNGMNLLTPAWPLDCAQRRRSLPQLWMLSNGFSSSRACETSFITWTTSCL